MTLTRKPNTYGGGANTNVNGLKFEQTTSLDSVLESNGFKILDNKVFFENKLVGWSVGKRKLYTKFLKPNGIDYKNYNSKGWEPDVLDWALHLDESTPHIHERHVFDCENKHGEVAPQQEKEIGRAHV